MQTDLLHIDESIIFRECTFDCLNTVCIFIRLISLQMWWKYINKSYRKNFCVWVWNFTVEIWREFFRQFFGFFGKTFFHAGYTFLRHLSQRSQQWCIGYYERWNVFVTSGRRAQQTRSFEYRDPSRERHLEILMPTVDLHPESGSWRPRKIAFYEPFVHSYCKKACVTEEYSSFVQSPFARPFFRYDEITRRNQYKSLRNDIAAWFNNDVKGDFGARHDGLFYSNIPE